MNRKKTAAVLYICTGQYVAFWEQFYKSFEKNFCTDMEKHYFVFTDASEVYDEKNNTRIHKIFQENLGWPGNTLFRYRMFEKIRQELEKFDYISFMNANINCVKKVEEKEFFEDGKITVVWHAGAYTRKPFEFTYDRNPKSTAYIPYSKGQVYVCGGVNGAQSADYLELIDTLADNIQKDYEKGIIALWHDESHFNRYILDHTNYKLLSPAYCYPQGRDLPFDPVLLAVDKTNYIKLDEKKVTEMSGKKPITVRIKRKVNYYRWKLYYELKEIFGK